MAKKSSQKRQLGKKLKDKKKKNRQQTSEKRRCEKTRARTQAAKFNEMAESAWDQNRFNDAVELFVRAVENDPDNPTLLINLARSYGLRFDHDKSTELIEQIIDRFGEIGHVHYMLAETEVKFKNFEAAETHYRMAIQLGLKKRFQVRAHVALARILERLHRLDEAMESAEFGVSQWPDHPKANLIHAQVLFRAGQTDRAFEIFERLADRGDVSPDVKADAWYAIAGRHERAAEYDDAFAALCCAKSAYRGFTDKSLYEAKLIRNRNTAMLSSITKEHFQCWFESAQQLKPISERGLSWLVGHPRSGTTLIEQVLDSHKDLVSADELGVFASSVYPQLAAETGVASEESITTMLASAQPRHLASARERYLKQIQGALLNPIGDRILLDKNPEMTLLLPVICRVFPEAKIIFAIRDPRDVVLSCFAQGLPLNSIAIDYHTIEGTAAKYAMMLNGWLKLREMIKSDWIEIRYEDAVADLELQARRSLEFLGLDWNPEVLNFYLRARTKHVHSPTYENVTRPVYTSSIGRWRHYEKHLAPVFDVLRPFVQEFGYEQ